MKKLKKSLKIIIFLLGTSFLLWNCEQVEFETPAEETVQDSPRSKITLESFKNLIKPEQYNTLSQNFDINKQSLASQRSIEKQNNEKQQDIIITDTIHQYQTDNGYSFTFLITKPQEDPNKIYNLIVELDSIGNVINTIDVEYIPNEEWLENPNAIFTGRVSAKQSDIGLTSHFSKSSNRFSRSINRCYQPHIVWTCYVGRPHRPGHPACQQNTFYADIIMVSAPCLPEDYYTDFDPSSNSNSYYTGSGPAPYIKSISGGSPISNPFFKTGRQIKADYILERVADLLTFELANWLGLNARFEILDKLETYLKNNSSEEAELIASEAVAIFREVPFAKMERIEELYDLVKNDPWALIQDCAEQNGLDTQNYLDLYNLAFPQECSDRLDQLGAGYNHQPITDGNVPLANIDYYGVEVTNYPDFNNDGNPDSETEIYQAFREKFTDLASGEADDFQFSCDTNFDGDIDSDDTGSISWDFVPVTTQDGIDFISNNPISSILLIEADASGLGTLAADDGAVIVTHFNSNDWTIATIYTDNNGSQPFSGNRQWGWLINQNGNFEFFTRAVDVANISTLINIFSPADTECQQDTYYNVAEATWENMQQEIAQWINNNGGQAVVIPKTAVRVDKEKIEELLTSNDTISEINCN